MTNEFLVDFMEHGPLISVIMPVFNCEKYISYSINSILEQSYKNWELIIINDCSTDKTFNVINKFSDKRIKIINNIKNLGIARNRNIGINESKGKYIAWLDSDDIALFNRLEKQVTFLEKNKEYGLCASNVCSIDKDNKFISEDWYSHKMYPIEWELIWKNPFAQSSVMIRKECLIMNKLEYDSEFEPAEDYELWTRLARYTRLYRLDDVLLHYRILDNSAYRKQKEKALVSSTLCNKRYISYIIHSIKIPKYHEYIIEFNTEFMKKESYVYSLKDLYLWYIKLSVDISNYYGYTKKETKAIHKEIKRVISFNFKSKIDFFKTHEWLSYFFRFDFYYLIVRVYKKIISRW